jgi:hypothetical protein
VKHENESSSIDYNLKNTETLFYAKSKQGASDEQPCTASDTYN